jgi:ribonuclease HI
MKANWDASVDLNLKRMSTGVVVHDEKGVVVAASMSIVPFIRDPILVEAIGAWHALSLCRLQGFSQVIFEGDSQVLVLALHKGNQCCSSIGQIIEDTRHYFSAVHPYGVNFVKREANTAAHKLAKSALCRQIDQVWVGECPPDIQRVVATEQIA